MSDEMNQAIRAAAGRERRTQSARADSETAPEISELDVLKAIAAHEAGLPLEAGRWVKGEASRRSRPTRGSSHGGLRGSAAASPEA